MNGVGRTRGKICGVRDVETALVCARAGADAVGLVFAQGSPRLVTPERAAEIARALPPFVTAVGLFVDTPEDEVVRVSGACRLGMVQLHGGESPEVCARVGEATGLPVMRAVRFDERTIRETIDRYSGSCSALLVDGSSGGRGERCDWTALAPYVETSAVPIVVAGGLSPENVGECVRMTGAYGVDVSSGVESARGVKDHALIELFVCNALDAR